MKKDFIFVITIIVIFIILAIGLDLYQAKSSIYTAVMDKTSLNSSDSEQGMKITIIGGTNVKENGDINSMGYIIRTDDGKLIIVDGGKEEDSSLLLNYIIKYGEGRVDYWFITHAHIDHVGALVNLVKNNDIQIENLCYNLLTDDWYKTYDKRGYESEHKMLELLNSEKIINIDNIKCEILRVANPEVTGTDNGNETSMVFKLTDTVVDKSILFLGDAFNKVSEELLLEPEMLKSYAVQMAHHGQNGVTKEVYDAINPSVCFFNCPEWLYNNDNGGGYNSGDWNSIIVREWMEEKNTTNILAFEGDQTIQFTKDGFEKVEE